MMQLGSVADIITAVCAILLTVHFLT